MENVVELEVKSSRLPGFYKLGLAERAAVVAEWAGLNDEEHAVLAGNALYAAGHAAAGAPGVPPPIW